MCRRVVALGGGTGLPVVLRALRRHLPRHCRLTAVVTAADDGGSSGVLRREYGVLPPGDFRNCLIALAQHVPPEVTAALQCRLSVSSGPDHAVGNLLLTALDLVASDHIAAIRLAAHLLRIEDVILPSTTTRAHLIAELVNGGRVLGESAIPRSGAGIRRLSVDPPDTAPAQGVLAAISAADAVILGPGSLYTSLLATLVVPGIAAAVTAAPGVKIFICNLMTEPGETDGYRLADHLNALAAHGVPMKALDYVVLHDGPIDRRMLVQYAAQGAAPVETGHPPAVGPQFVSADLLERGPAARHDAEKLGGVLCRLVAQSAARSRRRRGASQFSAGMPSAGVAR